MRKFTRVAALCVLAASCGGTQSDSFVEPAPVEPAHVEAPKHQGVEHPKLSYPEAAQGDVVDDYHGTRVPDPYRWLENPDSEESRTWIEAQNKLTFGYLDEIPARERISERLTKLWDYEKFGTPFKEGGRYFWSKNDGLQNQSVLYWAETLDGEPKVLLDPNTLSEDGTVALAGYSISDDGKLIAYGIQDAGSDWATWRVREIDSGKDRPDELKWIKFSRPSWSKDGKGLYYSRYPEPKTKAELTGANFDQKVYYHKLGDKQAKDELIFDNPHEKKWGFGAFVSEDGDYLLMSVWKGTGNKNLFFYKKLDNKKTKKKRSKKRKTKYRPKPPKGPKGAGGSQLDPGLPSVVARKWGFVPMITSWEADYSFVGNEGSTFWFFTDKDAPRGRLISIEARDSVDVQPKELIPQTEDTLRGVSMVGGKFFANYLHDAYTRIKVFALDGKHLSDVELPGIGSAGGFGGKKNYKETFYRFTGFTTPPTIFRYDVTSGKSTIYKEPKVDFDGSKYETRQVKYKSKDGTVVPMFIVHKKGLKLDGNNPTYLYGYGGFNVSLTPYFSVTRSVWLDMGGVYAVPNIRGGGEYGEDWHQAGIKLKKQNVFDDFIAAAEWLIANKYTNPKKLAISGGSNGGLLVGAVMTQRPGLFGAALPHVGVMDMLRFHKFTIGWAWIDDYGSSDDPAQFKALRAYSPLHNIKDGVEYPPTMIFTGDHDDRVVPGHSFKFAARLQAAQAGSNPILIRIETRAGHGGGKPTAMRIAQAADEYAFLTRVLGMNPSI